MGYLEHYRGKRVLLTGHTGFKGSWLAKWLSMLGAEVYGYALPAGRRSLYNDAGVSKILKEERLENVGFDNGLGEYVRSIKPDMAFHLAAEAIVGNAHEYPINTWQTNVIGTLRLMDALWARTDCGSPVKVIKGTPKRLSRGKMVTISSVEPELEMAMTTSSRVIMPISPWLASPGCTKNAGLPVLAKVAAILQPIWPDLPMPVTIMRPRQLSKASHAMVKFSPIRWVRACTACASVSITARAK